MKLGVYSGGRKNMSIRKQYRIEVNHIIDELKNMQFGNFYEVDKRPGTPSARTIAKNVLESFNGLLDKIENNKESIAEQIFK